MLLPFFLTAALGASAGVLGLIGMRRVFDLDVLACRRCGNRLRVLATVQDPAVARNILARLGPALSPEPTGPAPTAPAVTETPIIPPWGALIPLAA